MKVLTLHQPWASLIAIACYETDIHVSPIATV